MRRYVKNEILDLLNTLLKASKSIKQYISSGKREDASFSTLLQDCQDAAISIGNSIEGSEGEGTDAVKHLEDYCELLYKFSTGEEKATYKLDTSINACINEIKQLPERIEAVFLPYKASMWDSLESVWMVANEDPDCDAYVIPIPYYDKNPDGSYKTEHYEGALYPKNVPVIDYRTYNIKERHPDVIFIHNPYDDLNFVTEVHPDYHSKNLRPYTDTLVYIPYYATAGSMAEAQSFLPSYMYSNYIVVQSEKFIDFFDKDIPREKFLPFGSPKFDSVIRRCQNPPEPPEEWAEMIKGKKVFFYNTSISGFLDNTPEFLKKMKYVFDAFKGRDDVCMIWRPHPLLESTIDSLRPEAREIYEEIKKEFIEEKIGILDTNPDMEKTIALSDAYLGDAGTSVISLFAVTGKPIYILNNYIHSLPEEDDWKVMTNPCPAWDGNDRYKLIGNRLYKRDDDYHYSYYCDLSEYEGGGYYLNVKEFSGKVYVFPQNAEHILAVGEDKSIRKIELRHCTEQEGAFYSIVYWPGEKEVFLIPDRYPYLVRFNTENEKLDYVDGISEYNNKTMNDGERVKAAVMFIDRKIAFLNPQGTEMLFVDPGTLEIEKKQVAINDLMTTAGSAGKSSNDIFFIPYEGTNIVIWNKETNSCRIIDAGIEGLKSVQRPRQYICNKKYFGGFAFHGNKVIVSPTWANKFVEIDTETNMVSEWKPPFEIITDNKNDYWQNFGIGSFIWIDPQDWINDKLRDEILFYNAYERKTYRISLTEDKKEEYPISFDKEDFYRHNGGFVKFSQWLPYCCFEGLFDSIKDILDGDLHGKEFDKNMQIEEFKDINSSPKGDCGQKVFEHIKDRLNN